jgi:hypothetical protein
MKKQTAVRFIELKLLGLVSFDSEELRKMYKDILLQAKEMEKQQIINCYNQSWHFRDKPYETAEKYYNETFGGKDEQ